MFYEPRNGHPFQYDPFKALVSPRPIGWISTISLSDQTNLAPYSFFNAVAARPPMLLFSSEGYKHSARNAVETGEFVFNLASRPMADQVNLSSVPVSEDVSEFEYVNLETAPCRIVRAPRIAKSPASLECKVVMFHELNDLDGRKTGRYLIVGEVVGVHIDDNFLSGDRFDVAKAQIISRCGYNDYAVCSDIFEIDRVSL